MERVRSSASFVSETPSSAVKEKKKKKSIDGAKSLGEIQKQQDFQLEASTKIVKLDTSKWPLLLKVSV